MNLDTLRSFLGWGAILNFFFVSIWFFLFLFAKEGIHRLHSRWFPLSRESFAVIHYSGMAGYKLLTWLFFAMPYFVLRFCL